MNKNLTKNYYRVTFKDGSFSIVSFTEAGVKKFRDWVLENKPDYKKSILNARGMFLEFLATPQELDGIYFTINHQDEAYGLPQDWEAWGL